MNMKKTTRYKYETQFADHFNRESVAYRKFVREVFRRAGYVNMFRNKQKFGYSDKWVARNFDFMSVKPFPEIAKLLGLDATQTNYGMWLTHIPNQPGK